MTIAMPDPEVIELTSHLDLNSPASESAIGEFLEQAGAIVPSDYVEFLRYANGGESNLDFEGYESGLARLHGVEEIVEFTRDYFFDRDAMAENCEECGSPFLPEGQWLWIVGNNGADAGFCLDPRWETTRFIVARYGCLEFEECYDFGTTFLGMLRLLKNTGERDWRPLEGWIGVYCGRSYASRSRVSRFRRGGRRRTRKER